VKQALQQQLVQAVASQVLRQLERQQQELAEE
jgi:hypothetical protein